MSEFMEHLPDDEILRLAHEADVEGGDYEAARHLIRDELARRSLNIVADPTGLYDASQDLDNWQVDYDDGETVVRGEG